MIKVFAIDDHKMLIESFSEHFNKTKDIEIIDFALSGKEAVEKLNSETNQSPPDVILLDIGLGDMNGIECAKLLLANNPDLKIIGLSTYMQVSIVKKLLKTGAKAYISKATDISQLEEAIRKVHAGESFLGAEIQKNFMNDLMEPKTKKMDYVIPRLTAREKEVLQCIAEESSTKEIALELFISVNTVETHRKNLISKFNVKNSVGLIRKAIDLKLLD